MITQEDVLKNIARLMGMTIIPQGDLSDWEDYAQEAFNYAWRYYKWDWSVKVATVDLSNSPYLPSDFDPGGYREAVGTPDGAYTEVNLMDFARSHADTRVFSLEYDEVGSRYKVNTRSSGVPTMDFVYQTAPPKLGDVPVMFPSALIIAIGATIWAKQADNPTRADISQEWDEFHAELDRHTGRMEVNKVQGQARNLYDVQGTYFGDTRS